jgi:hypothetical protein
MGSWLAGGTALVTGASRGTGRTILGPGAFRPSGMDGPVIPARRGG